MMSRRQLRILIAASALTLPAALWGQRAPASKTPAPRAASPVLSPAFRPDNLALAFPTPARPIARAPAVGLGVFGDVNADELVNILDAQQIARHSAALDVVDPGRMSSHGDVDEDGGVNVIDAQLVARYAIGLNVAGRVGNLVSGAIALFPWDLGRRWYYDLSWESTVISQTGLSTAIASGPALMYGSDMFSYQGRSAWRVFVWEWLTFDDGDVDFRFRSSILSTVNGALDEWSTTDNAWRRIFDPGSQVFANNAFLLAGGPDYDAQTEQFVGNVSVPYGTFSALGAEHDYSDTGEFNVVDVWENRIEWYAADVGLVRAWWDVIEEQNQPVCCSTFFDGEYRLRYLDEGPMPAVGVEGSGETNNAPGTADALPRPAVVIALTAIGDAGTVVNDANVFANSLGSKLIQDFWTFTLTGTTSIKIDLKALGATNDLDLYLFTLSGSTLTYVARSTNGAGANELLHGTAGAGTYVIGIQAWDTPALDANGDVLYFLSLR